MTIKGLENLLAFIEGKICKLADEGKVIDNRGFTLEYAYLLHYHAKVYHLLTAKLIAE